VTPIIDFCERVFAAFFEVAVDEPDVEPVWVAAVVEVFIPEVEV
jgi:hypothetical protein